MAVQCRTMSNPTATTYLLLDAARMQGAIHRARELNPDHTCLYEGDSERFLAAVAPWLFSFDPTTPFGEWVVAEGAGRSWGVFLRCAADPVALYKHLRKFLIVENEEGREMYFRYYDPRVLRAFLPTCGAEQLKAFFGPVDTFLGEDEQHLLVEFGIRNGGIVLNRTERTMTEFFAPEGEVVAPGPDGGAGGVLPVQGENAIVDGKKDPPKRWDFGF